MSIKQLLLAMAIGTGCVCSCNNTSGNEGDISNYQSKAVLANGIDTLSYAVGMRYSAQRDGFAATLRQFGSDSAHINKLLEGFRDGVMSENNQELLAYYLGLESGIRMRQEIVALIENEIFGTDTTSHLNLQNVLVGFYDYMNGKETFTADGKEWEHKDLKHYLNEKIATEQLKVATVAFAEQKQKNEAFFQKKSQEAGMKNLDGILYKELKKGKGPHPTDGNMAIVEYEGRLIDGTLFDQTYAETNYPIDGAIDGLRIALKNMQPGAEWEICIPWTLGYGAKGRGTSMPPFATLTYKIKLINFK